MPSLRMAKALIVLLCWKTEEVFVSVVWLFKANLKCFTFRY